MKEFLDATVEFGRRDYRSVIRKRFFKDVHTFLAHMEFEEVDHFLQHDRFLTVIVFFSFYFASVLRRFVNRLTGTSEQEGGIHGLVDLVFFTDLFTLRMVCRS